MNWPLELSDNLLKNKVIVIEDLTVTAGQGLSLATRILENQNDEHLTIHNEITSTNIESSEIASVLKLIKSSDKVILLNSLTTVILCNTLQQVSQFLNYVRNSENLPTIVAIVHGDCHESKVVQIVKNYTDLWIQVKRHDEMTVIKSHPKGKIETYTIKDGKKISENAAKVEAKPEELPTSSFNLNLSQKEKEDRSKVEMPFWKKKEGKIDYVPDENDDWDDEDPDEDLDF